MNYSAPLVFLLLVFLLLSPGQLIGQTEEDAEEPTTEEEPAGEPEEFTGEAVSEADRDDPEVGGGEAAPTESQTQVGYTYSFEDNNTEDKTSLTSTEEASQQTRGSELSFGWLSGNLTTSGKISEASLQRESSQVDHDVTNSSYELGTVYRWGSWVFAAATLGRTQDLKTEISIIPSVEQKIELSVPYEAGVGYSLENWAILVGQGHGIEKLRHEFGGTLIAKETYEFDYNVYSLLKNRGDATEFFFELKIELMQFPAVDGEQVNLAAGERLEASYAVGYVDLISFGQTQQTLKEEFDQLSSFKRDTKSAAISVNIDDQWTFTVSETNIEENYFLTPQTGVSLTNKTRQKVIALGVAFTFGDL